MSPASFDLTPHAVLLAIHIGGGAVGILSGFATLAAPKGERLHRASGAVFFFAMLVMTGAAATLAILRLQPANLLAATLTAYLVVTGRAAARRAESVTGLFEVGAMFAAGVIAAAGVFLGVTHVPPFGPEGPGASGDYSGVYYAFAGVAALAAALDLRVGLVRGLSGPSRVSRHLWRMCTALFVASASFFLGQIKVIPHELRGPHLYVLALAPLIALIFWMVRLRLRPRRAPVPSAPLASGA